MKRPNSFLLALIAAFALALVPAPARAQEFSDDDEFYEEDSSEDEEDDEEGEDDGDRASMAASTDIRKNSEGVDNPDGRFTISAAPAALFQKMMEMERDNALMELQIKREKLTLDLERQRAEKEKVKLSLQDEENARKRKAAEENMIVEDERMRRQAENAKIQAELKKQQSEDELNRSLMAKIAAADMSDPNQVSAVAQLLAMTPGAAASMPAMVRDQVAASRASKSDKSAEESEDVADKYIIRSIVGSGGNYTANMETNDSKRTAFRVKKGSKLDSWGVMGVAKDSVLISRDGETKTLYMK